MTIHEMWRARASVWFSLLLLLPVLIGVGLMSASCGRDEAGGYTNPNAGVENPTLLGGDSSTSALTIAPDNPTLDVSTPGKTLQFRAMLDGAPAVASWTSDVADIGTIDASGLFTASARIGGATMVTARVGALVASTTLKVVLSVSDNPGNVDPATQSKLLGGGNADPTFTWLYPYDATVFARGISPPLLQVGGTGFDAAYLRVSFSGLEYKGFYGTSSPGRIQIPDALWKAITLSATGTDAVKVQLTKISGGQVSGPIDETWTIAQGSLRGTVYYNSYDSVLAGPKAVGAVLSLRPGQSAKVVVAGCRVCHSVSADGSTMVASNEIPDAPSRSDRVWDLKNNAATLYDGPNRQWAFAALYPDGSRLLRFGAVPDSKTPGAPWAPNVRGMGESGDLPSALFDPKTGASIPAPGLDGQNLHMMMPAFSPDGRMVAFNHYDTGGGHSIAVMDFDAATNTFSNLRDVATMTSGYLGWPAFTPDNKHVLFANGTNVEYDSMSDDPAAMPHPQSDIHLANVGSRTVAPADRLNGKGYLPFGEAAEGHLNFEPTILPEAVGGYYWVVFTSRREYGNTLNGPDPYSLTGQPGSRKKLWVAAIDIGRGEVLSSTAQDITHPAFYLDGQELAAGNMRGFWTLDPCAQNGASCETGDGCCSGFCRQTASPDGGVAFACVPPTGCAQESERCARTSDCCNASSGTQCIAGFCATPIVR
jgi:hypothetical protein